MGFADLTLFRNITPFQENEVSNDKLLSLQGYIDPLITRMFSTRQYLKLLTGNVDGSNNIFYTKVSPIANISGIKRTVIDDCDVITGWSASGGGGTIAVEDEVKRQGSNSLQIPKDGVANTISSFEKTISTQSFRKKVLYLFFYVTDKTALDKLSKNDSDVQIRLYDGSDFFQFDFGNNIKSTGWHVLTCNPESASFQSGAPKVDEIDKIYLHYTTNNKADTLSDDDIIMDYWYVDHHEVDNNDVQVFYATNDANNAIVFGNPQGISSVDAVGGRITMTTAPTSTTAPSGIYGTYYSAPPDLDYSLIVLAATNLLAHYASAIISGRAPNYTEIREAFIRRDTTGQRENKWLDKAIDIMNQAIGFDSRGIGFRNVNTRPPEITVSKLGEIDQTEPRTF